MLFQQPESSVTGQLITLECERVSEWTRVGDVVVIRVEELALEHELGLRIGRHELLSCLVNQRQVSDLISKPVRLSLSLSHTQTHTLLSLQGQRFKGQDGQNAAASLIQV